MQGNPQQVLAHSRCSINNSSIILSSFAHKSREVLCKFIHRERKNFPCALGPQLSELLLSLFIYESSLIPFSGWIAALGQLRSCFSMLISKRRSKLMEQKAQATNCTDRFPPPSDCELSTKNSHKERQQEWAEGAVLSAPHLRDMLFPCHGRGNCGE